MPPPLVRRTAHAGVLAALTYAALKGAWGLGSRIGVTDDAAFAGLAAVHLHAHVPVVAVPTTTE